MSCIARPGQQAGSAVLNDVRERTEAAGDDRQAIREGFQHRHGHLLVTDARQDQEGCRAHPRHDLIVRQHAEIAIAELRRHLVGARPAPGHADRIAVQQTDRFEQGADAFFFGQPADEQAAAAFFPLRWLSRLDEIRFDAHFCGRQAARNEARARKCAQGDETRDLVPVSAEPAMACEQAREQ